MCRKVERYAREVGKEIAKEAVKQAEIEMIRNVMNINHVSMKAAMSMLGISAMRQKEYLQYL